MDDRLVAPARASRATPSFHRCKVGFPDGSMTASGLRREALRGRMQVERIAGKDYTTLEAINEMRELCRVQAKELASINVSPDIETASSSRKPFGSSRTATGISPQDALRTRLEQSRQEAEQALADYIARKYQPERSRRDIEDIDCADVLSIYLTDIGEPGEQHEIEPRIERLNDFWGGKMLAQVNAQTCAGCVKHRGNAGAKEYAIIAIRPLRLCIPQLVAGD
jgi:hypothetical protein